MFSTITNITYKKLLESSLDSFNNCLVNCFKSSIEKVLQDLFYQAEFAKTNQQELELFEQYNQLRKKQDQLSAYLKNALQRMPVEFTEQIRESEDVFKLSLVDDSELEISLELNQIESSISSRFIKQLFVLEKRINVLFKSNNISKSNMPMGANSICWILKTTIDESSFSLLTKSALLKAIKGELKYNLSETYQYINNLFVEAKILPNIEFKAENLNQTNPSKTKRKKAKNRSKVKTNQSQSLGSSPTNNVANTSPAKHLASSIFELMNQNKPPSNPQNARIDNKIVDQSLKKLSELSNKSIGVNDLKKIKEILLETIQNDTGIYSPTLSQNQENSIDMMDHFYNHVKNDKNLDNNITASLDAINIPLIRLAVSDQEFFNNEEHPAREYLEKIIHASQQWHGTSVINDLQKISINIANEFEGSCEPFEEANKNIDDYLQVTRLRSKNSEKKHVSTAKGKEKLQSSREIVHKAISKLLALEIPAFVKDVINTIIQDSLTLCLLRFGEDSVQWKNQLEKYSHLVKMTHFSSQQEITSKQKIEALHHLDQTMDDLGFSKNDRKTTIDNFKECSQSANKDVEKVKLKDVHSIQPDPVIEPEEPIVKVKELSKEERLELTKFKLLSFGTMFDFLKESPDEVVRRKLSWFSPLSNKALFVSLAGRKPYECSMNTIAIGIHNQEIVKVKVEDNRYFNRFLTKLLNKLKKFT
jgi:hypothetical protein